MPIKPTKGNAPAAETVEALSAKNIKPNERTEPVNSISHPNTVPALSFSLGNLQLRIIVIEGEPWFIASDVCAVLGIDRTQIRRLDDDEKGVYLTHTLGGEQEVAIISEPGFYSLTLSSRKPDAKRVKRWVTHEVLPSIRKTGGYSLKKQVPFDRQIARCQSLVLQIVRCDDAFGRMALIQLAKVAYAEISQDLPDVSLLPLLVSADNKQMAFSLEDGAS